MSHFRTNYIVNAVDNENTKNLQSDQWRAYQLLKSQARDGHPMKQFATGNLETLKASPEAAGLDMRELLLDFHAKYYSSNTMKVCIYGKATLDAQQAWAEKKFGAIVNKELTVPQVPSDAFPSSCLRKKLTVVPVKDNKSLELLFPMPSQRPLFRSAPCSYLSHLIGHESSGSVLAALKAAGLANGLSCGLHCDYASFAVLAVTIDITDEGLARLDEVIECFFAYVGLLRSAGPQEWIWKESKELSDMYFRFLPKSSPSSCCLGIASNMHLYPKELSLSGAMLQYEMDLQQVSQALENVRPENALVCASHQAFAQVGPMAHAKFSCERSF
jgi:insulysin